VAGYGASLMVLMHKILCHDAVKTSVLVREKRLNFFSGIPANLTRPTPHWSWSLELGVVNFEVNKDSPHPRLSIPFMVLLYFCGEQKVLW